MGKRDISCGPTGPRGPRGQLGMQGGGCPVCENLNLKWDPESDVTSCPVCGWNNCSDAEENRQKQIENGEIGCGPDCPGLPGIPGLTGVVAAHEQAFTRMFSKVNILGTEYTIAVKKYDEDEAFERLSVDGYCDSWTKQIVVCDMSTHKGWEHDPPETAAASQKEAVRHEIVHAFLDESGLSYSSNVLDGPWAKNEEMVDWFAIQGPKIFKAWQEAGVV